MVHYERVPICSDEESDDCENNSGFNEKRWSTIIVLLCVILSITCVQNKNPTEIINKRYVSHKKEFGICGSVLFGNVSSDILTMWYYYHRALGFDSFYLFYEKEIKSSIPKSLPGFYAIQAPSKWRKYYYHGQGKAIGKCLQIMKNYSWIFVADPDLSK